MKKRALVHWVKGAAAFAVTVVLLCLPLASCGEKPADIDMYDLCKTMRGASDKWQEMKYVSSEDNAPAELLENISDMDYAKVNAFFIYYAAEGAGNADEIAVIQVKNKADLTQAADSLTAHLNKRKSLYATYDRSQLAKLEKGRVVTKNGMAALIVADDADQIEESFFQAANG